MTHVQIEQTATTSNGMVGYLTWWTITEAERNAALVKSAASSAGVPQWIIDRVAGRNVRSAWALATQLGAKGVEAKRVSGEADDVRVRFLTRDLNSTLRVVVREVIDPSQVIVDTQVVGRTWLDEASVAHFQVASSADNLGIRSEVQQLLDGMEQAHTSGVDMVDERRIADLVRDWLDRENRVCVRGTGGVYLVPAPRDAADAQRVERELIAIRDWLNSDTIKSLFSVVEVRKGGATTLETFVQSAVGEVKAEMEDLNARLEAWSANQNMNDGSRLFSSGTAIDALVKLRAKVALLTETLGDEIAVVDTMLTMVEHKAQDMNRVADAAVKAQKDTKEQETLAQRQEREAKLAQAKAEKEAELAKEKEAKRLAKEAAAKAKAEAKATKTQPAQEQPELDAEGKPLPTAPLFDLTGPIEEEGSDDEGSIVVDHGEITREPVEDEVPSIDLGDLAEAPKKTVKRAAPKAGNGKAKKSGVTAK